MRSRQDPSHTFGEIFRGEIFVIAEYRGDAQLSRVLRLLCVGVRRRRRRRRHRVYHVKRVQGGGTGSLACLHIDCSNPHTHTHIRKRRSRITPKIPQSARGRAKYAATGSKMRNRFVRLVWIWNFEWVWSGNNLCCWEVGQQLYKTVCYNKIAIINSVKLLG